MEQDRVQWTSAQSGRRMLSWGDNDKKCNDLGVLDFIVQESTGLVKIVQKSAGPTVLESTGLDEVCHRQVVKIAVLQSVPPLQSNDTRARCYVCGKHTSSPIRLGAFGFHIKGPPCPHIACSLGCHGRLHNQWLEICQGLREAEDSLPSHRQSEVQRSRSPEVQEHTQSEVQQSRSPEVQETIRPEGVSEADPSSLLIHPDIDTASVRVEQVKRSINDIGEAIRDLNNLWACLRDFEEKQASVAGIIAGFLTKSPRDWLAESRRLTSRSILHLELHEQRLWGQLQLRIDQLNKETLRIKASRYDTSAGPSTSCSSEQEPRAT